MASILWIAIAPEFRLRGHMVATIRPFPAVAALLALIFSTAVAVAILPIVIAVSHFAFLITPRAWPQSPHAVLRHSRRRSLCGPVPIPPRAYRRQSMPSPDWVSVFIGVPTIAASGVAASGVHRPHLRRDARAAMPQYARGRGHDRSPGAPVRGVAHDMLDR